jgi:hypothetical protein
VKDSSIENLSIDLSYIKWVNTLFLFQIFYP